jgi:hypothetical protein
MGFLIMEPEDLLAVAPAVREDARLAQREEHVLAIAQGERGPALPVEIDAQPGADRRDVQMSAITDNAA